MINWCWCHEANDKLAIKQKLYMQREKCQKIVKTMQ